MIERSTTNCAASGKCRRRRRVGTLRSTAGYRGACESPISPDDPPICWSGCGRARCARTGRAGSASSRPTSCRGPSGWPPADGRTRSTTCVRACAGSVTGACRSTPTTTRRTISSTPTWPSSRAPRDAAGWPGIRAGATRSCTPARGCSPIRPAAASPEALARLIGPARAAILAQLAEPRSTSQLVALTGYVLGSVGGHLKVLLDAELVQRRRSGRSVLYYRTRLGDRLAGLN